MTMIHETIRFSPSHRPERGIRKTSAIGQILLSLFDHLLVWEVRLRQRRQLAEMDDRLLSDTGISRSDALQEASKPFWKA